jgi:trehalose 6-phosphate phosphatase
MQSWSTLADIVKAVLKDYPKLKLTQGRKVRHATPLAVVNLGLPAPLLITS